MISILKLSGSTKDEGYIVKSSLNTYFENITSDKYSIKIPISGCENYRVESRMFNVKDKNFLITNPFQEVVAEVESKETVRGLCIYINPNIMKDVFYSSNNLFIEEDINSKRFPLILEHTYSADFDNLGCFVNAFKQHLFSSNQLDSNDFFYDLCELILQKRLNVHFQYSKIKALKTTTKKELYRRLDSMHQIIRQNFKHHISISDLAQAVGLSKFHAIRLYKNMYGISPYQCIQELRIEESIKLLKNFSITETAYLLNFTDRRAFSKAFKNRFGICPSDYLNGGL